MDSNNYHHMPVFVRKKHKSLNTKSELGLYLFSPIALYIVLALKQTPDLILVSRSPTGLWNCKNLTSCTLSHRYTRDIKDLWQIYHAYSSSYRSMQGQRILRVRWSKSHWPNQAGVQYKDFKSTSLLIIHSDSPSQRCSEFSWAPKRVNECKETRFSKRGLYFMRFSWNLV